MIYNCVVDIHNLEILVLWDPNVVLSMSDTLSLSKVAFTFGK